MQKKVIHIALQHRADATRIFHRQCRTLSAQYDVTYIGVGPDTQTTMKEGVCVMQRKRKRLPILFFEYIKVLWNMPADVYHCHEPDGIWLLLLLKLRRPKVKLVFDVHEYFDLSVSNKNKKWYIRWYYRSFVWFVRPVLLRTFDAAICVTPELTQQYSKYVPNTYTVHNYPDTAIFDSIAAETKLPAAELYLVHHGRNITKERGLFHYLDLVVALRSTYPTIQLLLIGNILPQFTDAYEAYITEHNLQDHVLYVGAQSHHNAIGYLRADAKKIGVFLPEDVGQMAKSVPVKVYEWLSLYIPQICSDHVIRFVQDIERNDAGRAVGVRDVSAQVQAIHNIYENYTSYQQAAKSIVHEFNWDHESDTLFACYTNLWK